jgi:hypothetical protein
MDDTQLKAIVSAEIRDATAFIDSDIGPQRALAVHRYHGRPYGDEEDGRSQVVSRDVHDTINAILPSLMRVFFGPENVVEFAPEGREDVALAEQATDYVNYIVTTDNDGFEVFLAAIKNALREKVGFVKWWWDESVTVKTTSYTGLDEQSLTLLLEELAQSVEAEIIDTEDGPEGLSVTLKLKKRQDRVRICAVPPEELLIGRRMRTLDDEGIVAHRTELTISQLVSMGYDIDQLLEASSNGYEVESEERTARNPFDETDGENADRTQRRVLYVESWINVDYDGDGIAELRRICTIGPSYEIVLNEEADSRPFADFHCDPEPHAFFGESLFDKVQDVEKVKTRVLRASLDSLAQSVFPRTVVGRGGNIDDAMNTEVGAILRAEGSPAEAYFFASAPFVGKEAFPMLTYMDELRENRTGMSKVSMGLDAEALQSTTATAANAQFSRSQERIELIARVMASGMRRLFRGILKLVGENQRAERMVKLRNQWVPVDPRAWRTSMDVVCNVGLGGGTNAEKAALLSLIAQKQEAIMLQAGMNNPLVTPKHLFNTYAKLIETGGYKDPNLFFSDPDSEEAQQRMANQPPPPPDPKLVEAQARMELETAKAQFGAQMDQAKAKSSLQIERERHQAELQMQRERMALEDQFRREQAQAELALKRDEMMLEAQLKREAIRMKAETASTSVDGPEAGGDPG